MIFLAAQMSPTMNMVTTTDPLMTDASIVGVVDLNTLNRNPIAKKIILVEGNVMISPGQGVRKAIYLPPYKHRVRETINHSKGFHPEK